MAKATPNDPHSAKGQMLGYLYQIDRALHWLSKSSSGGIITIETDDDVVARMKNGEKIESIFEQDKSSIRKGNPYSDKGVNLWKTLSIWLDLVDTKNPNLDNSQFILATNVPIKRKCVAKTIHQSFEDRECEAVLKNLKNIASKPSKTLKPYIEKVFSYGEDKIKSLIPRISLHDNDYSNDRADFRDTIRRNLKIGADTPFLPIYDSLTGWITNKLIDSWTTGQNPEFKPEDMWKLKDRKIAEYKKRGFFEQTVDNLPISVLDIQKQRGSNFVKQLELISMEDYEVIDAINDYLRSAMERTRYAVHGRLTKKDFELFDTSLEERWKVIFRRKNRLSNNSLEDTGYDIYSESINFKEKLAGIETEQYYTTRGAYHRLSNENNIGWHPLWKMKL